MTTTAKEKRDQLFRRLASLDAHFADDDAFPADGDRWRAQEGLELALTELVSGAPANEEKVRKTKITCASGSEWKTGNSMQASSTQAAETAALLNQFGIELSAVGRVVMTDFTKAESAYVHHSRVPVAVVARAIALPTFARGRFLTLRLVDVVAKAPSMDGIEQRALARVCGANRRLPSVISPHGCSPHWKERGKWGALV